VPVVPQPVERSVGGVTYVDRWGHLEDDTDEVLAWQAEQSRAAREALHGPHTEALRRRLREVLVDSRVYAPDLRGGRWFGLALRPGADQPVLQVADELGGPARVLVDPDALSRAAGAPQSVDFAFPSPDGSRVAYGVSTAGAEVPVVHVVDVDSGEVLPDRVPLAMASALAWAPDSSAFWFADADPGAAPALQLVLHRHEVGGGTERVPGQPAYRHPVVMPQVSSDGRWLAAVVDHLAPRPDHVLDLATGQWRPFLLDADGAYQGAFLDDAWVALTTDGAPRGRLVAVPLDAADDRSRWRELLPESDVVLRNVARAGTADDPLLVLSALVDATSRITVHRPDGTQVAQVALPAPGTAGYSGAGYNLPYAPMLSTTDEHRAALVHTTHTASAAVLAVDLRSGATRTASPATVELRGLQVRRFTATSADGTSVPYSVISRDDVDEPVPALLHGYGGFNVAFTPGFLEHFTPVVDAGGAVVHCQLRGGGEYGVDWWQAGRQARKQRTFDDLYAVAEDLVRRGLAPADRLACFGGSNGGVLTAVAGVQRPDLWAAVVPDRPVLDLLSCTRDPYTLAAVAADYGMPLSPVDAPALAAWSPYQNVRDDVAYPPTLVVAGANDARCPAWHARKHVARLREAGGGPVLLRVWEDSGHLNMDADAAVEKAAEWLSFVLERLGLSPSR
jgi:prolyl oligopeptidase